MKKKVGPRIKITLFYLFKMDKHEENSANGCPSPIFFRIQQREGEVEKMKKQTRFVTLVKSVFSRDGKEEEESSSSPSSPVLSLRQSCSDDSLQCRSSKVRATHSASQLRRKRSSSDIECHARKSASLSPPTRRKECPSLFHSACAVMELIQSRCSFEEQPLWVGRQSVSQSECYYKERGIYIQVWREKQALSGRVVSRTPTHHLLSLQELLSTLLPLDELSHSDWDFVFRVFLDASPRVDPPSRRPASSDCLAHTVTTPYK